MLFVSSYRNEYTEYVVANSLTLKTKDCEDSVALALSSLVTPKVVVTICQLLAGSASERLWVWNVYITWLRNQHKMTFIYDMIWHDDMTWHGMTWHDMTYDMTWHDMRYDIASWYDMIWYDIISCFISYHMGTNCLGYELSWVRVVLGTSCLGYELSWVRVVLGTYHTFMITSLAPSNTGDYHSPPPPPIKNYGLYHKYMRHYT